MSAAAATTNGITPASTKSPSANPSTSASKNQLKTNASGKVLDGARKQAGSPIDTSSSKKPAPKAWQGTNPITQRPASTSTSNGISNGSAKNPPPLSKATRSASPQGVVSDKQASERMLLLVANFTGLPGRVTLRNGEKFEGIFAGASLEASESRFSMKMVKRTANGTYRRDLVPVPAETLNEYIGEGADHIVAFEFEDTIDLNVSEVQLATPGTRNHKGAGSSFRTDAEISGASGVREKELKPWQPGPDSDINLSLDESSLGNWDQFATNETLYNVQTDYDESLYTTTIDRTDPRYKEREAKAARIAKEINGSEAVNSHVAEERKMNSFQDGGVDEEEKYSGVRRDFTTLPQGRTNAYVPPSRRPITSQPTVSGAPFDPAIISAQIARPAPASLSSDGQLSSSEAPKPIPSIQLPSGTVAQPQPQPQSTPNPPISITAAGDSSASSKQTPTSQKGPIEGVERKVLDSFKQFSNQEKLRLQNHQRAVQERNRVSARHEKSVKLNDLKKFAENFKLYSRVPDDLVPILAKTKEKQTEIVSKAEQQAREKEVKVQTTPATTASAPSKPDADTSDKAARAVPVAARPEASVDPASPFSHRQRTSQNFRAPNQAASSPRGPAPAGHRIPPSQAQNRPNVPGPLPMADLRIPPTGPSQMRAESDLISPESAASTRFNVKAMEFRPNPSASAFTPGPGKSSPESSKRPSVSVPVASPPQFFKITKPLSERTAYSKAFNAIKRLQEKAEAEGKTKDYTANGGIPQAYRTLPTWECAPANKDKSYAQAFQQSLAATISPMQTPSNGGLPHQHQLPLHMQNVPPQVPSAQQTPRFYQSQPHHGPNQHIDDHRMQYASATSSVQPSPRMGHPTMAYNGQMHPQMQNYPGGMPPYAMSPAAMQMRPMPAGPPFGPQMPQMGGHMMVQQPSNGPYMNGPMGQQMMYPSPGPGHVQPHFPGHAQQPGAGGQYAPRQGAHPMSHQGSQQGHQPGPMYMVPPGGPMMMQQHPGQMAPIRNYPQPQYQGGPHPGYQMQHRQMSGGGGYNHQMTPRQHHAAPQQQGPSGNAPPMHGTAPGDEGK